VAGPSITTEAAKLSGRISLALARVPNEKIDIHQIISLPIQSIYLSTPMLEPP